MLQLRPVDFHTVQTFFMDFQKKSRVFDLPSDEAEFIGIYKDNQLIGYYALEKHSHEDIEVLHGYLCKDARHVDLPSACMELLESACKAKGFKRIALATGSRFGAYMKFAKSLGYRPVHLEFIKEL